jgi:hypothetical protein
LDKKWDDSKEKMNNDQRKEIEDKIYWFNANFPHNPKPSSEILNYQRILKGMVKQKQYDKANDIQLHLNDIIHNEKQKWNVIRDKKLKHELENLQGKHDVELFNFDVKMKKSLTDFRKTRISEHDKLLQKYKNKFKELEQTHKIELSEFKNINTYNSKLLSGELISKLSV